MKRNRYLLCFLLAAALIYYAIPQLPFTASGSGGLFASVWLGFALLVIAGNLSALLYSPKKKSYNKREIQARKRIRSH
ncbi:hypothetical protein AN964_07250 [Heyndrickxia shackletonii]|uniref:Uncharacterized protein n=1 Tax=Heyndrickxia shackletonii TaxID=157838 RepID=A0A0Q3TI34_9BACI|nr:hypothetical protein [Heyndrickxia shackletonii]KQL53305.1 hypothetical protein AN964_07250 [Heyndrickxia shackletonii]MBB2480270.1 hypothetical protein [Bacillus sp. APMAM]NEZ01278.1 hypothetical protein [Heyndrickxia shackletonii]RTZ56317.1 hypothetical protein EKO25_08350 [Bacillus sp. SAJ1]